MPDKIGLSESIAMAVGGIFAVLGVVATQAGTVSWLAFVASGIVVFSAGYSFIRLDELLDRPGSPITIIKSFIGSTNLADMMSWTFVIGYIGTMGLYACAFGSYFVAILRPESLSRLPLQPVVSSGVVLLFVGVNAAGAHATGQTEDSLVVFRSFDK